MYSLLFSEKVCLNAPLLHAANNWGEPEQAQHWSWQQPAYVYMYVCMYVSNICRTLVSEIRVHPEMLRVVCYIWRAHVRDL